MPMSTPVDSPMPSTDLHHREPETVSEDLDCEPPVGESVGQCGDQAIDLEPVGSE